MKLGDYQEVDAVYTYIAILELQGPCKEGFGVQNLRLIPFCAFVLLCKGLILIFKKNGAKY